MSQAVWPTWVGASVGCGPHAHVGAAPEVLTKRGYSAPVDFWSLGILAYELMFGKRPFRGKTNSALTHSIIKEALSWPEDAPGKCSTEGMQAIRGVRPSPRPPRGTDSHRQFLERDPNRRLGYRPGGGGFQDVKNHPWFRGIDWVQLFNKESTPPFEPDVGPMLITTEVC